VHRDVKPGNLLRAREGEVKLADFGIAKATEQSSITQVGSVLGTAAYLAPEQARGEDAGPRADLYSLGVVAYQLMSGRLPYEANSLSELTLKQQREMPPPLNSINPAVPAELSHAVALALALDQYERPLNAIALADALRDGLNGIEPTQANAPTSQATNVLRDRQPPTAATRVRRTDPATEETRYAPRQAPRAASETRRAADSRRAPAEPRRRGGAGRAFRRVIALLALLLVFLAAVVVAVVIATSTSSGIAHFRTSIAHDANSTINQLKHLVNSYTK
jgi:serine/threonine-protein kinase